MTAVRVAVVILILAVVIIAPRWPGIRDTWRAGRAYARSETQRVRDENEAIRLANDGQWRLFVLHHPLDDACPDCSLWDAEGDRRVIKPCERHKEAPQ